MKLFGQKEISLKNTVVDWERLFKVGQDNVFGLDIGTTAIKIVQLLKNEDERYTVVAAGIVHYESDSGRAIRQCVQSAGIRTKLSVCGVCGSETAVRHFKFPSLLPEEIDGAVKLEAKQVCPFNADESTIDYQLIPGENNETKGTLVVASNKLLKEKAKMIKDASLSNVLMDIDGLALLNCLRYCEGEEDKPEVILNVGSAYATLAIIGNDGIPFIRDINYAGKAIIENISRKENVPTEAVKESLFEGNSDGKVHIDLCTACDKLITDVTETLCYDAVRRKSEMAEKIYLCGGFALAEGFADLLSSQLPVPAVMWNPFDKISCDTSLPCADILGRKGPAFAVAAGLAMRGI